MSAAELMGVMTMFSTPIPVLRVTMSSIWARCSSVTSFIGTTMSAVSPVRFTTTSVKPLASRRSSVADSFSTSSVISTMLWTALWRSVSERLVLLMISFKDEFGEVEMSKKIECSVENMEMGWYN